jgi:hypothetical protein
MVRHYFALTNFCNRECPLCSCHSDPGRKTFSSLRYVLDVLAHSDPYEVQLEGGEPLLHPDFPRIVEYATSDERCLGIIVCTNAVKLPWVFQGGHLEEKASVEAIQGWLARFAKKPFTLKPSINAHLIERDRRHLEKMGVLLRAFEAAPWKHPATLRFNVRIQPQPITPDGEQWLLDALEEQGLTQHSNIFNYQAYGKAKDTAGLQRPFIVENPVQFHLHSPDERDFGMDLEARADHMQTLA